MISSVDKVFINECFVTLLSTFFRLFEGNMDKLEVIMKLLVSYPHFIVDNFTQISQVSASSISL